MGGQPASGSILFIASPQKHDGAEPRDVQGKVPGSKSGAQGQRTQCEEDIKSTGNRRNVSSSRGFTDNHAVDSIGSGAMLPRLGCEFAYEGF